MNLSGRVMKSGSLERTCIVMGQDDFGPNASLGEAIRALCRVMDKYNFILPSQLSAGEDWKLKELFFSNSLRNIFTAEKDVVGYNYLGGKRPTEDDWSTFFAQEKVTSIVYRGDLIKLTNVSESVKNKIYRDLTETYSEKNMKLSRDLRIYFIERLVFLSS